MGELSKLQGLGKKSELQLNQIGVYTKADLQKIGAIPTYIKLGEPHLCFLYALAGALEDRSWIDVAQNDKTRLIIELDNYKNI
ncbi:DNA transformation protein TfoX [uncultured Candidatus Thioglobus sp.]|nr:DNA transformation protein TfoX [uncultured Candidatus Thioglobus sp.]